ncbi:MAG: PCRF domain-containing protein [Phycisphaeraceae bacterium]|nr:PCRF domain-containing protein [Phycisphaeraceae bacterium]MCB9848757.1 PCRF domain-containing protein [Phycisphaeraceae bacterium]
MTPPTESNPTLTPAAIARLNELRAEREALTQRIADPDVLADHHKLREITIRKAAIDPVVDRYERLLAIRDEAAQLRESIESGADAELAAMATDELPALAEEDAALSQSILEELVTSDDNAVASVILELRAGQGGDEAAIWAGDLLEMYRRRAERAGWAFELLDASPSDLGGFRHAVCTITGPGVWTQLAHEAGVHCVKRVPATETQGRVHTSTATVAVLPEPQDVEITIDPGDVVEHITTAQGPGGQNVNKVATAVHLIHKPTGVEVRMQESKSQRQNRDKAWRLLRARLYDIERQKQQAEREAERRGQIGAGGRSERIRTYRYKDNQAVDHRLNESFNLQSILAGDHDDLAAALHRMEIERRLASM